MIHKTELCFQIWAVRNNLDYQAPQRAENMHQADTILPGYGVLV